MLWKSKEWAPKLPLGMTEGFPGGIIYMESQRIHSQLMMGRGIKSVLSSRKMISMAQRKEHRAFWRPIKRIEF